MGSAARAIEVTILAFTMKFQTGAGGVGADAQKEKSGGAKGRGDGVDCAGDGNIDGTGAGDASGLNTPTEQGAGWWRRGRVGRRRRGRRRRAVGRGLR